MSENNTRKNPLSFIRSKKDKVESEKKNEEEYFSPTAEGGVENNVNEKIKEEKMEKSNFKEETKNKLEEENTKLKETLMRTLAELDNTRRRALEENEKTMKYAISKFAEDLIPVMEDFYLAFKSIKENEELDKKQMTSFIDGIKLTHNELKKVFEKHGLVRNNPVDQEFDPSLHNAITQIEGEEDNKIVEVLQPGYSLKDRLLRPALVVVSKKKGE